MLWVKEVEKHERNFPSQNLELVAIIKALKMWRCYLIGKKIELRTEHNSLKHLFWQPTFNVRQIKWLEFLANYNFEIKHIKGKENKVVDEFERGVPKIHATTVSICKYDFKIRLLEVKT